MKPLPRAPLTKEDWFAWNCVELRLIRAGVPGWSLRRWRYINGDERDAELMLSAQEVAQFGPAAIQLHGIDCRGWLSDRYSIEDTEDGEGVWRRDV
jgi:hypothetical protein